MGMARLINAAVKKAIGGRAPGPALSWQTVAGSATYLNASGQSIVMEGIKTIDQVLALHGDAGYVPQVKSISGATVVVDLYYADYDAVADGALITAPDGDYSSTTNIYITVVGH